MAQEKRVFVLTCLLVVLPIASTEKCPNREDVAPCTCEEFGSLGVTIECHKIDDGDLAKVTSNLRGRDVKKFFIEYSKLGFIPHDVFKGVKLKMLEIEKSTLTALTDRGEAFVGLEYYLEELNIYGCVFKNEWDWSFLKNLKKLKYLSIISSLHLETLGTDVNKAFVASRLEFFNFFGNNVSFISDHAFDSFKDVRDLFLNFNKIKNVNRTMLPNPAPKLHWLDLSFNLIEEIPKDMFTNLPNLRSLNIDYNKILVLNEVTFSPVWEQLNYFSTLGNDLRCDCIMTWLLEKKIPNFLYGECASPPELNGKELSKLKSEDFMCYV